MGRPATGGIVTKTTAKGVSYGARFRALGRRQFVQLGYSSNGMTQKLAEQELANILADVRRGIWRPPQPTPTPETREEPTFHEFASEWLADRLAMGGKRGGGLSEKGEVDLRWRLQKHLLPFFARMRLGEINAETIDRYKRLKLAEGTLSARSINMTLACLSAILEQALEYELIPRNPASSKRRRLPEARPKRTRIDRASHILALLDAVNRLPADSRRTREGQRRAVVATLLFAGPRINELINLRWRDVDLARGTVEFDSKTDAGERTVDLLPVLRDELADYRARLGDVDPSEYVFPTATGGRMSESNVRNRILAPAVELANAKLEHDGQQPMAALTPHSCRRTFASILASCGEQPAYLMAQLGHTKAEFSLSVYASAMARRGGENELLRALVKGDQWAPMGTNAAEPTPTAESVRSRQ